MNRRVGEKQGKGTRGISGIVAMIFMGLLLTFFFVGVFYVTGVYSRVQQAQQARMLEVSKVPELVTSVRGEWWYDTNSSTLVVSVSNHYSEAVSIPGIVVVMPDGSYYKVSLNVTLSPGETRQLSLSLAGEPSTVIAGVVSGERLSAKLSLSKREEVVTPFPPGALYYWERAELASIYSSPTLTWFGEAEILREKEESGTPNAITVDLGNLEGGSAEDLAFLDGSTVTVSSVEAANVIRKVNSTLIVFDDFDANPLADGRLVEISGDWRWTASIVEERSTRRAPLSNEHIAYVNMQAYNVAGLPQEVYVVTLLKPKNNEDYHGIVFLTGPSNSQPLVELAINPVRDDVTVTLYYGLWVELCSSGPYDFKRNTWYAIMARSSPLGIYHNFSITAMDQQGNPVLSCYATVLDVEPAYVGLANYLYARTEFDAIYISNGTDPRYVYLLNATQGYSVVIESGTATFTGYYDDSIGGYKIPLFPNPQKLDLVLENAALRVYSGQALVAEYVGTIKGGDYYSLQIGGGGVSFTVDGTLDISNLRQISEITAMLSVTSNSTSTSISVYLYDWTLNSYRLVAQGTGSIIANVSLTGWSSNEAFGPNGAFKIKVEASDDVPFILESDVLNLRVRGYAGVTTTVLLVGYDRYIDVYEVGLAGSTPSFTYLYTVAAEPPVTLGVDSDFAYSSGYLYVALGGAGIYRTPISPAPAWENVNSECRGSSGRMLILENIDYAGTPALLFAQDVSYCVVNATTGSTILAGGLPEELSVENPYNNYLASAYAGTIAYVNGMNTTSNRPVLLEYNANTNAWRVLEQLSVTKVVGMAYSPGTVWVIAENGPIYSINTTTGALTAYSVTMPFSPSGPGDRMEYINSIQSLLYVRDDDTSEVWTIKISS